MPSAARAPRLLRGMLHPRPLGLWYHAAVAVVLVSSPGGLGVVLVERSRGRLDPWSGDLALPGGRVAAWENPLEPLATVFRELWEEACIPRGLVEPLGWLGPEWPRNAPWLTVAPLVLVSRALVPRLCGCRETRGRLRVLPLASLAGCRPRPLQRGGAGEGLVVGCPVPGGGVVWGMTLRIVSRVAGMARETV